MKEIEIVKFWLKEVIIGLNLCPYAKAPYEMGLLDIKICYLANEQKRTHFVFDALESVLVHSEVQYNCVVAFPTLIDDFVEFNDWVSFLNELLSKQKMSHLVQLIAFHPQFKFEDTSESDLKNFVNSSPYPTIHILKNAAIDELKLNAKDGEKISKNNEKKLSSLSVERRKELFFWKN